jgi:hypothetical protein
MLAPIVSSNCSAASGGALKRKDFTAITRWTEKDALSPKLVSQLASFCRTTTPFLRFLAKALDLDS